MKHKVTGIFLAVFLLATMIFTGGAVYAQDENLPDPGTTPDSPLYIFDKLGKNISLFFTFGAEAKAKKALRYAEERLAETEAMAARNKVKQMEQAAGEYDRYMAMVQQRLEETARAGQSDNISETVALATGKHLEVLARIREQVSEKAQEAIAHAENVSMNGQINALRALGKDKPVRVLDICDNITDRQLAKIKEHASENVTSDNETSANITSLLDYAARIAEIQEEMAQIAASLGINVTAIQERLAHSTANRLQVLAGVYDKAPEQARNAIASAIENSVQKYQRELEKLNDADMPSVNATLSALPQQVKEKIHEAVQVITANSGNETQLNVNTQTEEKNREGGDNPPTSVPGNTNQTQEQQETQKQDKNTSNKP